MNTYRVMMTNAKVKIIVAYSEEQAKAVANILDQHNKAVSALKVFTGSPAD